MTDDSARAHRSGQRPKSACRARPKSACEHSRTLANRFPRILLVSNQRSFGLHLREALTYHQLTAIIEQEPNTQAAVCRLAAVNRLRIHLVLVALPLQQGFELVDAIRHASHAPGIPLVLLEPTPTAAEIAQAMQRGADGCCALPRDWHAYGELTSRLHQLLVRHESDPATTPGDGQLRLQA